MISLGPAFVRQAIDDAFLRLLRERVASAIETRDAESLRVDVEDLFEASRQVARAIDNDLPR